MADLDLPDGIPSVTVSGSSLISGSSIITSFLRNMDLLRNYRFRVVFPALSEFAIQNGSTQTKYTVDLRSDDVETVTPAFRNFAMVPWVSDAKENYYPASRRTTGNLIVTFYEHSTTRVISSIEQWRAMLQNEDGTYNYPVDVKKRITLQLTDGLKIVQGEFILKGVWPADTICSPLSYNQGSHPVMVTQVFSVDDIVFQQTNTSFLQTLTGAAKGFISL